MPGGKRKFEPFDPNKSDSDDDDYVSGPDRPRKVARKSRTQSKKSSGTKRRKAKYKGSDVSDDDVSDSLLEDSFSEEGEEEVDLDLTTGRRRRTAATKQINYEDPSDSVDGLEEVEESLEEKSEEEGKEEEEEKKPPRRSQIIKLKVPTPFAPRTTRAGSAARTRGAGTESASSGFPPRRSTRARTEEGEDLIALTNSGRNFEVVRPSRSPEAVTRSRTTRGHKGVKKPASIIKEETEEPSSHEQPVVPEEGETIETDLTQLVEEEQGEQHPASMGNSDDHQIADDRPLAGEIDPIDQHRDQAATEVDDADADDDDSPITRAGRTRGSRAAATDISTADLERLYDNVETTETSGPSRRLTRKSVARKSNVEQSSDFEPADESAEEDESVSDDLPKKGKGGSDDNESTPRRGRSSAQEKSKSNRSSRRRLASDDEELDQDELIEEAQELKAGRRANRHRHTRDPDIMYVPGRRERKPVDYTIKPMDQIYAADEDAEDAAPTPSRGPRGKRNGASQPWERSLYTTYGPFGGAGGPPAVIGGPWGTGAIGGVDSDSSDDENIQRPGVGGNVGMTPTSAIPLGMLPGLGQTHATDPIAAIGGTPANLGKIKSQKALADADPLGVDQNVDFSKVGGLAGHIDQLKEMVQMPLLYPELFLKFHVTPPRGVLFHGPPGTGKTLLARALAASVGSGGRKITFYMRKGADALSKWVGEAERQLRLLFEEARKTQPSIIFFDEIDGLAPVRSSKQEQIHASIVSTLLALMDGMDGRGQVIVIGATNRPDNIDPALRRPGRFDREFYFPLPDFEGRRAILDIHTKDWGIDNAFKNSLAHLTKGYGGADLRALCTEAALNAIQRTYPQIYSSNEKLIVNPDKIKITAKDFMLSIKSMIPSSERATSSGAAPLPKVVEPLLREQLTTIEKVIDGLIPIKKKVTALQEAMYEQYDDGEQDFGRETLQQEFEKSRVFRPRLLVHGLPGMGQAYIGAALLNHFEGLHVQNFDLPTIYSDSTRSAETTIVQLFTEVKRHKPSVIYIPGIDTWYRTLSGPIITTFLGLLRTIPTTDPILVLGIAEADPESYPELLRDLFGFSKKNQIEISRPSQALRVEFFLNIMAYIRKGPKEFPDPVNRKLRKLEVLQVAPPPSPKLPTKEEIKALKKKDRMTLNILKTLIQPIMDQINRKYKKFRTPVLLPSQIQYLYEEQDPNFVRPDIPQLRPYELSKDKDGTPGILETETQKFFYNLETTTIEERLSNGFYARPKDFLADIRSLAKDAKQLSDKDRLLKANELLSNVEVDIAGVEADPRLADCENVYHRQLQRAKEKTEKYKKRVQVDAALGELVRSDIPLPGQDVAMEEASGPINLGEIVPSRLLPPVSTPANIQSPMSNGHLVGSHHLLNSQSQRISNGSSAPSRHISDDTHIGGTDSSIATQQMHVDSQTNPLVYGQWRSLSRWQSNMSSYPTGTGQQSQTSAFQQLPHDISPRALINDASTTTSGKKTSQSTQLTNGRPSSKFSPSNRATEGDSQLPDTQHSTQQSTQEGTQGATSSDEQWVHSQAYGLDRGHSTWSQQSSQPAVPPFDTGPKPSKPTSAGLANILNSPVEPSSSQISSEKDMVLDETFMDDLLNTFTKKSSGCSIEQMEQINRELMDTLWKMRGEYNRTRVAKQLLDVFNEVIKDIETMQKVLQPSQPETQ